MSIIEKAEAHVKQLLKRELSADHTYHNWEHTLSVRENCKKLGRKLKLNADDMEVLELAALFHDVGFIKKYEDHETESIFMAKAFLEEADYSTSKTARVLACIDATRSDREPTVLLEKILKDADLANLGSGDYLHSLENLRKEWESILGKQYSDEEWYQLNHKFLKKHEYYTEVASERFGDQHGQNKKKMKAMKKKKKKEADAQGISGNRSAQMMFKTSLRNHIDLSTLADNKANIMLSVNALIITIAMPLAASYVKDNMYLLLPMIILLLTCLVSMIFATLATRPIKMHGYTTKEIISQGTSNLFFFGNFYRMNFQEYQEGMQQVVSEDDHLENSIMRDLFYLGNSLGIKYSQLRICYNIFMFGIILSVFVFSITYGVYMLNA